VLAAVVVPLVRPVGVQVADLLRKLAIDQDRLGDPAGKDAIQHG